MAEDTLRRLLDVQRRRLVASIMSHAERELYPDLTPDQQKAFRSKVLSAVGSYHDVMLDILGTRDETELINLEAIELLRDVRDRLAAS